MPEEPRHAPASFLLFVQLNDLYHIDTSADYLDPDSLILPRIATFVDALRDKFSKLGEFRFCVPGDFLSPSCLSKQFHGAQMVDVLNQLGVDCVSFGNHEFEPGIIGASELEARIQESRFVWLNTNFEFHDRQLQERLSERLPLVETINISASHSAIVFGVLNADTPRHVGKLRDHRMAVEVVQEAAQELRDEHRLSAPARNWGYSLVGMTHQDLADDIALAQHFPALALIMGGHDHDVVQSSSQGRCLIVKTASNARTLRLNWIAVVNRQDEAVQGLPDPAVDPERHRQFAKEVLRAVALRPVLEALLAHTDRSVADRYEAAMLTAPSGAAGLRIHTRVEGDDLVFTMSLALDTQSRGFMRLIPPKASVTDSIRAWNARCSHGDEVLCRAPGELHLLDRELRRQSTNFGNLVADILRSLPGLHGTASPWEAQIGIVNSGSFRLDRNLQAGEAITPRTLCGIFGHENWIERHEVSGKDLLRLLRRALWLRKKAPAGEGAGNFLQISGVQVRVDARGRKSVRLTPVDGPSVPIDPAALYGVATTSYVARKCKDYRRFFTSPGERVAQARIEQHVEDVLRSTAAERLAQGLDDSARWVFAPA